MLNHVGFYNIYFKFRLLNRNYLISCLCFSIYSGSPTPTHIRLPENIKFIATFEPRTNSNINYKFPEQKLYRGHHFKHKHNDIIYQNVETLTQKNANQRHSYHLPHSECDSMDVTFKKLHKAGRTPYAFPQHKWPHPVPGSIFLSLWLRTGTN